MIKPTLFISTLLTAVLAFAVFQVENRVQDLRMELTGIHQQLQADREEIHVLKAEWTYLNQPKRLQDMVGQYLENNRTVSYQQVKAVNAIPVRPVMVSSN